MLINLILRAKDLVLGGHAIFASPALSTFLQQNITLEDFIENSDLIKEYGQLDDYDLWGAIKVWQHDEDKILKLLSEKILNRRLFKIKLSNKELEKKEFETIRTKIVDRYEVLRSDSRYLFAYGEVTNKAYIGEGQSIDILTKRGTVIDIAEAADLPNIKAMSKIVKKHYLCCPKNVYL